VKNGLKLAIPMAALTVAACVATAGGASASTVGHATPAALTQAPAASPAQGAAAGGTITVTATRVSTGFGPDATPDATITCALNVSQYPHNSGHVPGTINVVETAACTAPVPKVTVTAYLYTPIPRPTVKGATATGTLSVSSNAATTYCANGTYQGYGYMTVTFPPGYAPPTAALGKLGPTAAITCL
jgi:hypothetical protein